MLLAISSLLSGISKRKFGWADMSPEKIHKFCYYQKKKIVSVRSNWTSQTIEIFNKMGAKIIEKNENDACTAIMLLV